MDKVARTIIPVFKMRGSESSIIRGPFLKRGGADDRQKYLHRNTGTSAQRFIERRRFLDSCTARE
jgi:hypothetical protein